MSVTTPIFRFGACATDGATEAGAEASADASVDGAATDGAGACDADGEGVAPLVHAESRMAALPNSVRPMVRVRMCTPRSSRADRPCHTGHCWVQSVSNMFLNGTATT